MATQRRLAQVANGSRAAPVVCHRAIGSGVTYYLAQMRLERTLVESGITSALDRFHSLKNEDATGFSPALLDGLGWRHFRKGQRQDAIQLFQLNREQYPESYVTTESLGDAFEISENIPSAIRTYAEWVERHPEHERGAERLEQLRSAR